MCVTSPNTIRAAIYLRISQDATGEGLAVSRQREDCERIARQRGWSIVGPYSDTVSASKRTVKRPEYDRMVADFEAGRFDALICYDLDRLTRQPSQLEEWIKSAEVSGLMIVTANGEADLTTDDGRMFARIKATIARAEVERKGARQKRANRQRLDSGKPVPGRRRYGYEVDGLTLVPDEAAIVRRIYEDFVGGASVRSITIGLIADGVSPAPGRAWSPGRVRYVLNNPVYGGVLRHGSELIESDQINAVVSPSMAADARALLADPSRRTTPGPAPAHLLSGMGLATCGDCGHYMVYRRGYLCTESLKHPFIKKELLEPIVLREVARAFITSGPDLFPPSSDASVIRDLVIAHQRNETAALATVKDRDADLLSARAAEIRLTELRAARLRIEADLERARTSRSAGSALLVTAHDLIEALPAEGGTYAELEKTLLDMFSELDIDRQRDLVRALVYVQVDHGRDANSRVRVLHKLATHLNPTEETNYDALDYA
jgi:site-specific DNA recombinase